jgi:excinuclease ABC subunit C
MIVAGPEGFAKKEYRKFNIRSVDLVPGDDFGMMREVLGRRFKRLVSETRSGATGSEAAGSGGGSLSATPEPRAPGRLRPTAEEDGVDRAAADAITDAPNEPEAAPPWPDLVLIDGGEGQLGAVKDVLSALGIDNVPLVGIAKGPDRDAGRETFHMPGRAPFRLPPRDPVLYFVQRLRDEAHRFAIGSHRARRSRDIREAGLQEIAGIGPTRKRALLRHFGTLKTIERASIADLSKVPGVSAETARRIYDFFHEGRR